MDEQDLIKKREERFQQHGCWRITGAEEFTRLAMDVWVMFAADQKFTEEYHDELRRNIRIVCDMRKASKAYQGMTYIFSEFLGKPRGESVIIFYWEDILTANLFQKDLVAEHLYYIIHHEMQHYLGKSHEEMEAIEHFNYPLETAKKEEHDSHN